VYNRERLEKNNLKDKRKERILYSTDRKEKIEKIKKNFFLFIFSLKTFFNGINDLFVL